MAAQTMPLPPHAPEWQTSPVVQAFPSLHAVPSLFVGFEHVPFAGLQTPGL